MLDGQGLLVTRLKENIGLKKENRRVRRRIMSPKFDILTNMSSRKNQLYLPYPHLLSPTDTKTYNSRQISWEPMKV